MKIRCAKWFVVCLAFGLLIIEATEGLQAQTKSRIIGRITDASTGVNLVGANVMISGTNMGAATDRSGKFRIDNVPLGTFTLVVTYIGYEREAREVTVSGPTVVQDVMLKSSYIEMDAITVFGMRQGEVKALSQQRVSPNIKNVISEEQMQRFPDLNTTEVLQRIPGVTITRDQGEGRYVLIRGTEARLNNVTVNGQMVASPEDAERYVGLDVVGANQFSSIEVTKAITPDMDAEAIGGSVNLVTKSAFDRDERIFNVTLGGGYSRLLGKPLYQGKFTFSDRFGENKNWGLAISGNYYRSERGNHNNEMDWGSEEDTTGTEIPWALQDLDLRYYKVKRTRYGVSGDLEYRPSDDHRFYVRGMYNLRDDYENRFRLRIRPNKGDYVDATGTHIEGAALVRALKDRLERQVINYIGGGAIHNFGNVTLDYNVSYSWAKEEKPQQVDPEFELDEDADLTLGLSNPDLPKYTITNLPKDYEHDPSHWKLEEFGVNKNYNHDNEITGLFNLKYPFLVGDNTAELKIGGKARIKKKDRDDHEWVYTWEGDEDILLSQFVTGDEEEDYLDGAYRMGPEVDMDKSRAFFEKHKGGLLEEEVDQEATLGNTFVAKENIFAYYAMTTVNFGPLMVLGGFRHELTSTDYTGTELIYNDEGDFESAKDLKDSKFYHNVMPMIHFRYRVAPMTQFRLAVTSGISRPNYFDMVPYLFVFREDEELRRGNPELKPTTAYNFDLMGEHYFQGIGIFSGGFFYKSLKNIIYDRIYREQSGTYVGFEAEQATNGGSSWLWGIEVNWSQQFTFLPGYLSGFGIYANYTYTKSEADIPGRERTILPGQAGNVMNLALSYEKGGFTGRFGMNFHGKFIEDVGEDEEHDRYYHDHMQLDFSGSMRLFSGLRLFLEVVNINNEPLQYYIGRQERPVQREFYKWWSHVGLRYEL
jgi:TonB-dependent receptor